MSAEEKSSGKRLLGGIRRHLWLLVFILTGCLAVVVIQLTGSRGELQNPFTSSLGESPARLTATIPDEQIRLRWNGLVNSWRLPGGEITYNTEMQLPLSLRNDGHRKIEIEALRLVSTGRDLSIIWQAVWTSRAFTWERLAPIEPQIQQARQPLTPLIVETGAEETSITLDLVPLNHAAALGPGEYHNLLQAKLADTGVWEDLLAFDFTIPEDFELSGARVSG